MGTVRAERNVAKVEGKTMELSPPEFFLPLVGGGFRVGVKKEH
jgi:hypothetical protein